MFTEDYSFPHPVLGLDDDIAGSFDVTIEVERNEPERKIRFHKINYDIKNTYIDQLYKNGQADILIKVYCSSTFKTWTMINPGEKFEIDENDLWSKVEIQVYIVARNKILNYSDDSFNSQFNGYSFTIDEKEVIAISGKVILPIEKIDEELSLGNIFKFYSQESDKPIRCTYLQNKINIMYPITENGNHPPNILFKTSPWIAYSLFIVPALTGAFRLILETRDKSEFEDYEWYTLIMNIFPEDQWEDDPYVNAQKLLQKELPIINAYFELQK